MSVHAWNGNAFAKIRQRAYWTGSTWQTIKSSHIWTDNGWQTIFSSFTPSGMVLNAVKAINSTSPTVITGMVPNAAFPGSTINADGVVSLSSGPVRISFAVQTDATTAAPFSVAVYRNGVQVGETFTDSGSYNEMRLTYGSVSATVNSGDLITLRAWVNNAAYGASVQPVSTRLNVSAGTSFAALATGAAAASYNVSGSWNDIAGFGTSAGVETVSNALVAPDTNPSAILAARVKLNFGGSQSALRFLVNGKVVGTSPATGAYSAGTGLVASVPLTKGDLVKAQVNYVGNYGGTLNAGAKFAIL